VTSILSSVCRLNIWFNVDSNRGGVLQYDIGKWKDDDKSDVKSHTESHLNNPPEILLKAVKLLQSDHDFEVGEMKQYINEVANKSIKLLAYQGSMAVKLMARNWNQRSGWAFKELKAGLQGLRMFKGQTGIERRRIVHKYEVLNKSGCWERSGAAFLLLFSLK
jgi:hypothetical protein